MANTNVTMRIDETLKVQLQELLSNLGMDMTTFFTMAANPDFILSACLQKTAKINFLLILTSEEFFFGF